MVSWCVERLPPPKTEDVKTNWRWIRFNKSSGQQPWSSSSSSFVHVVPLYSSATDTPVAMLICAGLRWQDVRGPEDRGGGVVLCWGRKRRRRRKRRKKSPWTTTGCDITDWSEPLPLHHHGRLSSIFSPWNMTSSERSSWSAELHHFLDKL